MTEEEIKSLRVFDTAQKHNWENQIRLFNNKSLKFGVDVPHFTFS